MTYYYSTTLFFLVAVVSQVVDGQVDLGISTTPTPKCVTDNSSTSTNNHIRALDDAFKNSTNIDLIFMLDRSASIIALFNDTKDFLALNLVPSLYRYDSFTVRKDMTRIKFFTFGDENTLEFSNLLQSDADLEIQFCDIRKKIEEIYYNISSDEKTKLNDPLNETIQLYRGSNVRKTDTKKILWILTDGQNLADDPDPQINDIRKSIKILKDEFQFTIFTVAMYLPTNEGWLTPDAEGYVREMATDNNHFACMQNWIAYLGMPNNTDKVCSYGSTSDLSSHFPWWGVLLIVIAALLAALLAICLALALARRRRRKKRPKPIPPPRIPRLVNLGTQSIYVPSDVPFSEEDGTPARETTASTQTLYSKIPYRYKSRASEEPENLSDLERKWREAFRGEVKDKNLLYLGLFSVPTTKTQKGYFQAATDEFRPTEVELYDLARLDKPGLGRLFVTRQSQGGSRIPLSGHVFTRQTDVEAGWGLCDSCQSQWVGGACIDNRSQLLLRAIIHDGYILVGVAKLQQKEELEKLVEYFVHTALLSD